MQKLLMASRRRPRLALWLAYTGLFALLMGIWAALFAVNGKVLIWYGDATKQHYIALMYYGRYLRGAARALLTGAAIPTYDFSIGYGADIISTLSYYGLGDPLALTSALVPSQYTEQLLLGIIALRIYLAGLFFMPFSRCHGNGRFGTLLGAVAYAFAAWSIHLAGMQPSFLIPMYCFPLVLLGADHLFDGRRPTLYIAAIALSVLSNFVFFYMIAVLLVLYAVAKYFHRYGVRQLRTLPPLVARFLLYSLVGIAIAGATLLPTLVELTGGARLNVERQVVWYPFSTPFLALANLTTADAYDEYCSLIGICAPAVLAVMVLFVQKRRDRHLKLAWLTLFAFVLIPWAGVALNGFTYMQNRWVWAFALLEAFILARVCPCMAALTAPEKKKLVTVLAGYCLLTFWNTSARTEWALASTVLMLVLAGWLLTAGPQTKESTVRGVLLSGCVLGVVLNLGYKFSYGESNFMSEFRNSGEAWQTSVSRNPTNILKLVEDDSFWRYDSAFNEYENTAMLAQLHGTGFFWSLHNGYLTRFFTEMGMNRTNDNEYKGLDGRAPLEALLGIKYYLAGADRAAPLPAGVDGEELLAMDVGGQTVRVCQNEAALPVGFTVDTCLTREAYDAMTPIQRQDALLSTVLLEDDAAARLPQSTALPDRAVIPAATVTLGDGMQQIDEHTFFTAAGGGTLTFTVAEPPQNCESYFVVKGMNYTDTNPADAVSAEAAAAMPAAERLAWRWSKLQYPGRNRTYLRLLYNNGAEGFIHCYRPNHQFYNDRHDFAYALGRGENGVTEVKIVFAYAGYYRFDSLTLEYQPVADLAERTAPRREEALQNVVLGANSLTGEVTVSTDKVLVLQVPYSSGWRAYVDGAPAEILRADTAFMGLALAPGAHTVELRYQTPGLAAGAALSACSVLAFLLIALAPRFVPRRRKKSDLQPAPEGL